MQFFKGMFNGKNAGKPDALAQQFDEEVDAAVKRFGVIAGFESFKFNLKHPQTGQPLKPHEGLGGTFQDWKQVQSVWDRRRVLFDILLQSANHSMKPWQVANVLVAMRLPQQALELLERNPSPNPDAEDYVQHCAAFAKAFLGQYRFKDALPWARKAAEEMPKDAHIQTTYADAQYMNGLCDEANEIYSRLMKASSDQSSAIDSIFLKIFAREIGSVPSPVFAVMLIEQMQDPAQIEVFWKLGEAEFYDSPHFRMQHAYYLLKNDQLREGIAKLVALVGEMPWIREANINLENILRQVDPQATMMPEFQHQLRMRIKENGWTTEGMHLT